jgi:hypothetical protein
LLIWKYLGEPEPRGKEILAGVNGRDGFFGMPNARKGGWRMED